MKLKNGTHISGGKNCCAKTVYAGAVIHVICTSCGEGAGARYGLTVSRTRRTFPKPALTVFTTSSTDFAPLMTAMQARYAVRPIAVSSPLRPPQARTEVGTDTH